MGVECPGLYELTLTPRPQEFQHDRNTRTSPSENSALPLYAHWCKHVCALVCIFFLCVCVCATNTYESGHLHPHVLAHRASPHTPLTPLSHSSYISLLFTLQNPHPQPFWHDSSLRASHKHALHTFSTQNLSLQRYGLCLASLSLAQY